MHDHGGYTGILKGLAHTFGMGDGRAEHDRLAVAGLLTPMTDHGIGDGRLVENRLDLRHVEVSGRAPDPRQLLLGADINDKSAWRHKMAGGDQFAEGDLIRDVAEDLPQTLAVTAGRRRRHPEDLGARVLVQHPVDYAAVRGRGCVMRFIDHQQIEDRDGSEMVVARQRLHHRERGAPGPGFVLGIEHGGADARIHPCKLGQVLAGQFIAMSEDAGLGIWLGQQAAGHRRQHDGLARPGGANR